MKKHERQIERSDLKSATHLERNLIIGVILAAIAAGVIFGVYRNRKNIKSVLIVDDCGTLNMDFTDQAVANSLGLNFEVINYDDEILESVAL